MSLVLIVHLITEIQQASVLLVTLGVILATTSRPSPKSTSTHTDLSQYSLGVLMLSISLLMTGVLGILQERAYTTYGPCWKEGIFYTVRVNRRLTYFPISKTHLARPLATNIHSIRAKCAARIQLVECRVLHYSRSRHFNSAPPTLPTTSKEHVWLPRKPRIQP